MNNSESAVPSQQEAESLSGNTAGVGRMLIVLDTLRERAPLRVSLLAIGLIGLALIVSSAAGWVPVARVRGLRADERSRASVSEEKSTLASGDESSEPIDQESLGLLLKTPQPEPTPTPVLHTVVAGENLLGIAAEYGVKADLIAKANDLWDPNRLRIGQVLLIPPPQRFAYPVGKETPGELRLWWPLQGEITTYFGEKESYYIGGAHTGIDIAANVGDPVRAAAAGKVVVAWKRTDNVGWHIVLDHGNGYSTLYGHLSKFLVEEGDLVEQGQVIGAAGDTGFSFGPHLHFELRQWGTPIDPLEHLPD